MCRKKIRKNRKVHNIVSLVLEIQSSWRYNEYYLLCFLGSEKNKNRQDKVYCTYAIVDVFLALLNIQALPIARRDSEYATVFSCEFRHAITLSFKIKETRTVV